jgi:hypothetical protein
LIGQHWLITKLIDQQILMTKLDSSCHGFGGRRSTCHVMSHNLNWKWTSCSPSVKVEKQAMARHFFRALFLAALLLPLYPALVVAAETVRPSLSLKSAEASTSTEAPAPTEEYHPNGATLDSNEKKQAKVLNEIVAPRSAPPVDHLPVEASSEDAKQPGIPAGPNGYLPVPATSEGGVGQPHQFSSKEPDSEASNKAPSLSTAFQPVNLTEIVAQCLDLAGCSELLTTSAIAARHAFTERAESARLALAGRAESAKVCVVSITFIDNQMHASWIID